MRPYGGWTFVPIVAFVVACWAVLAFIAAHFLSKFW